MYICKISVTFKKKVTSILIFASQYTYIDVTPGMCVCVCVCVCVSWRGGGTRGGGGRGGREI